MSKRELAPTDSGSDGIVDQLMSRDVLAEPRRRVSRTAARLAASALVVIGTLAPVAASTVYAAEPVGTAPGGASNTSETSKSIQVTGNNPGFAPSLAAFPVSMDMLPNTGG